jgi:hypothetical protein
MTYSVKASRKEVEEKETLKVKVLAPLSSFGPPGFSRNQMPIPLEKQACEINLIRLIPVLPLY